MIGTAYAYSCLSNGVDHYVLGIQQSYNTRLTNMLLFSFAEEKLQVRKAILNCSLIKRNKGGFEDEAESGEDDEE